MKKNFTLDWWMEHELLTAISVSIITSIITSIGLTIVLLIMSQ